MDRRQDGFMYPGVPFPVAYFGVSEKGSIEMAVGSVGIKRDDSVLKPGRRGRAAVLALTPGPSLYWRPGPGRALGTPGSGAQVSAAEVSFWAGRRED